MQVALEGKYAHSPDVVNGLHKQLPSYIRTLSADFGIYLIYWMRCERFQEPKRTREQFDNEVVTEMKIPGNIQATLLDFSYPIAPSRA